MNLKYAPPIFVAIVIAALWIHNDSDTVTLPSNKSRPRAVADEHSRAVQLLSQFNCSSSVGRWGRLMAEDKRRAEDFLKKYEQGINVFTIPIDKVIENQLEMFNSSCAESNRGAS